MKRTFCCYSLFKKKLLTWIFLFSCHFSIAQLPNGFVDEMVSNDWNTPIGLTFDTNGRMYVWEKNGRVFIVENGNKQETPLIDLREEVLDFNDHGLGGFALDPNFLSNGYIYLMYAAKRYFVENYGTEKYSKETNLEEPFKTSIGRIVRYTANKSDNFRSVDYNSRKVLIGETLQTGIPILVDNHGVGSLVFGSDGTLLASVGDAAIIREQLEDETESSWFQEAVEVGIISEDQLISAYRSQSLNSLNGKIIRIDPENGDGISSNPYFDSAKPRSAQSRIWAYGLRNPFRFSLKPNSGSKAKENGNPGILFVGDVGWINREEINIVERGGLNFGWPHYEGISHKNQIFNNPKYIPEKPKLPIIDWRLGAVQGVIGGEAFDIGSPQFKGNNFKGNSSIGGIWYPDDEHFPKEFRNTYFHGDFEYWVKCFRFDEFLSPKEVIDFTTDVHPTCFAINPKNGAIYYTNYSYPDINEVRQLSYSPNSNLRPTAVLNVDKFYGASPLEVQFSGSLSKDPEGEQLKFEWNFGDSTYSTEANPKHTFSIAFGEKIRFTVTLKVTDNIGQISTKSIQIFVGNAPPIIQNTTIDTLSQFDNAKDLNIRLDAKVANSDKEKIIYQWSVVLHHDDHTHFQTAVNNQQGQIVLASVPCDGQKYFYRVSLKITDSLGLSTTMYRDITPICKKIEIINPPPPTTTGKLMLFALKKNESVALLKWATVIKNTGGFFYEIHKNGQLLRRIDKSATFVEVSIDKTKAITNYQIFAKDNAGNTVSSNVAWVTSSLTPTYPIFSFEQTTILIDFIISDLEKQWSKQIRIAGNEDCPDEMTTITSGLEQKVAKNKIISIEKINQKTLYSAGKSIELKAGFKVENGIVFETKLEDCKN